jgi:hypothetical protein
MNLSPVSGKVYTLKQIDTELALRDSPFLYFFNSDGEKKVVQTSHSNEDLSNFAEWSELRFKYLRETEEWIPLFFVVEDDNAKILELLASGEDVDGETLYWPRVFGTFLS